MRLSEIIKSSFATLRMNGRRTFLTMIGIIIGIAAVITILSLGNGFRKKTLDELARDEQGRASQSFHFNVTNMDADWAKLDPFSDKALEEIEKLNGVDEVKLSSEDGNSVNFSTVSFSNSDSQSYASKALDETDFQILIGRNLTPNDSKSVKRYVIIDDVVAMTLFGDFDTAYHKPLNIDGQLYNIVGVYQTQLTPQELEERAMYGYSSNISPQLVIPKGTNNVLNPNQMKDFGITVYFSTNDNVKSISKQIETYLKENGPEKENGTYMYFDTSEMMEAIGQQLNMVTYFIGSVAGISLFIAGVGVMNMMYISVSERTKEIGIRRSLGATQNSIQWQFLLEGISITTLGGLIGYLFGVGIAILAGNFLPFKAILDVPTALLAVAISVLIGITFSVFPARAAARKNVVEILR